MQEHSILVNSRGKKSILGVRTAYVKAQRQEPVGYFLEIMKVLNGWNTVCQRMLQKRQIH